MENDNSIVTASEVIKRFGNISHFEETHKIFSIREEIKKYIIEY